MDKGKTVRAVLKRVWNDRASDNRMWNDDTNKGTPFIVVSLVFTRGSISPAPTVPVPFVLTVLTCLAFFNTRSTRETRDSSKLRPIIKNDRIHNKEKGSPRGRRALFRSKELHQRKILAAAYKKADVCRW